MSIPVQLVVYHKKFEVVSQFDSELAKYCLAIPKGYYDRTNLVWKFPLSELDNMIAFIKSREKYKLEVKSKEHGTALLLAVDDKLHFKYNWKSNKLDSEFLDDFKLAFPQAILEKPGSNQWCFVKKDYIQLKKFLEIRNIDFIYISEKILPFLDYIHTVCRQSQAETNNQALIDHALKQALV